MLTSAKQKVRCRLIAEADLAAVIDLLGAGFKDRARATFARGLARMSTREVPANAPRYGYCLEATGRLVGIILLIASEREIAGVPQTFCNVSSWYVDPDFRAYAHLLVAVALRNKQTTYTNISPAPHTWPIVESQGYTRYCNGLFVAAAALKRPAAGVVVEDFEPARFANMPGYAMLLRHFQMDCRVLVVREGAALTGYVFAPFRIRSGRVRLPGMLVIHAPDRVQLVRLAGNFGRHFLLTSLSPFLVLDADGPVPGLPGFFLGAHGRKYFKGPHRPALCDLADTEYAVFGV